MTDAITGLPFEIARGFLKDWVPNASHAQQAALGKLLARFSGMSTEEVEALDAPPPGPEPVHFTHLKHFSDSALHYLAAVSDKSDTSARKLGRLVHCLVLGGAFVVYDGDRRGKAWDAFEAEHKDEEIVTKKEYDKASKIAEAVLANPLAAPLLVGEKEVCIEWDYCGRRCSSRLDVIGPDFIADLKTTGSAKPTDFPREALKLAYHAQLAFYQLAARSRGYRAERAYLIAVETEPPYAVQPYEPGPEELEEGLRLARTWMEKLLLCEQSNVWPGYAATILPLRMPPKREPLTFTCGGEEITLR